MRLRSAFKRRKNQQTKPEKENISIKVSKELNQNLDNLKHLLDDPSDLVIREFTIKSTNHKCGIAYIDGLVDKYTIHNSILKNLQVRVDNQQLSEETEALFEEIYKEVISVTDIEESTELDHIAEAILSGSTIFYLDGFDKALTMETIGWEDRAIKEPESETVIRGPREGFVENHNTNMSLIRRNIRHPNLRFKTHQIGRRSKKTLVVSYVEGIVHPDILKEVNRRIETIDIDYAPDTGYIEQWIEDSFLSPFPQMLNTERPDKVASYILKGKVAIILDGTPFVLTVPATFGDTLFAADDYYERWLIGSLLRILRYLGAFFTVFLPSLYIALVSYQQGMIPSELAFSIAATRDGVPFPAFIEALLMGMVMEMLREAGARLPSSIGETIGIVGGLVIGEAAVQAGIVSPIMVIVVALTAISSFSIPEYSFAISLRMIRFGAMFAAAVLGLYGVIIVYIAINIHIVNLKSMGVPYTAPFAPNFPNDFKDLVIRAPITVQTKRPERLKPQDQHSASKGEQRS
ncbi:spore germination protein [Virgibacillus natechei]|nr:spore germination protein [Virgibacillus natechei]UZD14856.1 spore germination protein [Virgibacillus natechei]